MQDLWHSTRPGVGGRAKAFLVVGQSAGHLALYPSGRQWAGEGIFKSGAECRTFGTLPFWTYGGQAKAFLGVGRVRDHWHSTSLGVGGQAKAFLGVGQSAGPLALYPSGRLWAGKGILRSGAECGTFGTLPIRALLGGQRHS